MDEDKRRVQAAWWMGLARGKLGLALVGKDMLSKSLIQFSADEWGCVPALYFDMGPNYNWYNGNLL